MLQKFILQTNNLVKTGLAGMLLETAFPCLIDIYSLLTRHSLELNEPFATINDEFSHFYFN